MEIWKPIPDYEMSYEVSNLGRVRNKRTGRVRVLQANSNGYLSVNLGKRLVVHRLVMRAFTGENPDMFVNHINYDRSDNRLENLEWVTRQGNYNHSKSRILGGLKKTRKLDDIQVLTIRTISKLSRPLAREYKVSRTSLKQIIEGRTYSDLPNIF